MPVRKQGPKTIFFWAPTFKWGLVIAGVYDMVYIPDDEISMNQSAALAATGILWSRYSLIIVPVNYYLFSVNVFLGIFQSKQAYRAYRYQKDQDQIDDQIKDQTKNQIKDQIKNDR